MAWLKRMIKYEILKIGIMCRALCITMRVSETIGHAPISSDTDNEAHLSDNYCTQCGCDLCIFLIFHEEFIKSAPFKRIMDRLTTKEEAKGSYVGLHNNIIRFQLFRKFQMWRRDREDISYCVRNAIQGIYPFD